MPVGAFDQEGRLKKHALLGTSFASDPGREKKRKQYGGLYKEAVPIAGEGREAMVGKLSGRFQEFAAPQQSRLGEIAQEKGAFEAQAVGLGDPEQELRNKAYSDFSARGGFDASYIRDYENYGMPTEFLAQVEEDYNAMSWQERRDYAIENRDALFFEGYDKEKLASTAKKDAILPYIQGEAKTMIRDIMRADPYRMSEGGPTQTEDPNVHQLYYGLDLSKKRDFAQGVAGHMARTKFEKEYGSGAQESYEENIMKEVDKINESYIPLQEEEEERNKRLQDRMELYNMFLGG